MCILRRSLFAIAIVCSVVLVGPSGQVLAQQEYPSKPIRIVLGSAGSTPDILARLIGNKMSENWRQPVVIDNRPGIIAASTVAKSAPDGYTLLLTSPALAARAALVPNLPYDTIKDFAGVTEIGRSNVVAVVSSTIGVKSIKELVTYAEARPGKMFFATPPTGSSDHLTAEKFRLALGINAQYVAYKGQAESLIETAAGRSHFSTPGLTAAMPFIKDGKLVALVQQVVGLPGVPVAAHVLPQWKQVGSHSILAPAGTPLVIRQQISKEAARILNLPDVRERLHAVSYQIAPTTPEEHDRNLRADIAAFAKIIKEIGLKPN